MSTFKSEDKRFWAIRALCFSFITFVTNTVLSVELIFSNINEDEIHHRLKKKYRTIDGVKKKKWGCSLRTI